MPRVWFNSLLLLGEVRWLNSVRRDEHGIPVRGPLPAGPSGGKSTGGICVFWEGICGVGSAADLPLNAKIAGVQ